MIFTLILTNIIISCGVTRHKGMEVNPYFHINTGSPYTYYGIDNDKIKISYTGIGEFIIANIIEVKLSDSLNIGELKGESTYDIWINDKFIVQKSVITSFVIKNSFNQIISAYYRYDKSEKFCISPAENILPYDTFFKSVISTFKYEALSNVDESNIIRCKFEF